MQRYRIYKYNIRVYIYIYRNRLPIIIAINQRRRRKWAEKETFHTLLFILDLEKRVVNFQFSSIACVDTIILFLCAP